MVLGGLNAITALLSFSLPERESHLPLYERSIALLDLLGENEAWPMAYLHWELALLEEMGFGLDLSVCAVTGSTENLIYISPKSGRAVSEAGAGEWKDRLLPLPACLRDIRQSDKAGILQGLQATGYFLTNWLAPSLGDKSLPAARQRLVDIYARQG